MCRVLDMSELLIFVNFRKYHRVLNMRWDAIMEEFWIFSNFEYARFLRTQALQKVLNIPEYIWIMLYGRSLNMPVYTWNNRVLNMPELWMFLMQGLWSYGTSIKIYSKTQEEEALQGNILEIFFLDTLKTVFWMENLTQIWTQSGSFFPESGHFFWFPKTTRATLHLPLVLRQRTWLNMNHYTWNSINIL